MKTFAVECEDWGVILVLPDVELVIAEDIAKAETYFKKHFNKRILRIKQLKKSNEIFRNRTIT